MHFGDIFKESFLNGFSSDISIITIAVAILAALFLSVFIFFTYRRLTVKSFYSSEFAISLVCVTLITTAIIITIQSSLVVSLGMVGALSIVRFRTAIKSPMDLAYMFWAISVGIICGAGLAGLAMVLSCVISAVIILLQKIPFTNSALILIVNAKEDVEQQLMEVIGQYAKGAKVKSRTVSSQNYDYAFEIKAGKAHELIDAISEMENVCSASLFSHDGEINFQ